MLGTLEAPAPRDDDLGLRQLDLALTRGADRRDSRARGGVHFAVHDLGLTRAITQPEGEDIRPQRRHLRVPRAADGRDRFPRVERPPGDEAAILDRERDAVGHEGRPEAGGHSRRQVLAEGRERQQDEDRLVEGDDLGEGAGVRLGRIAGEGRRRRRHGPGRPRRPPSSAAAARAPGPIVTAATSAPMRFASLPGLGHRLERRPTRRSLSLLGERQDEGHARSRLK